jgi:hypothetical protein
MIDEAPLNMYTKADYKVVTQQYFSPADVAETKTFDVQETSSPNYAFKNRCAMFR